VNMSGESRNVIGIILLTVVAVEYGGYFMLSLLRRSSPDGRTELQYKYYRAGHAHAGVLVILAIIGQLLIDFAQFPAALSPLLRAGFFFPPILIPTGYFAGAPAVDSNKPRAAIVLVYLGALVLAAAVIVLGLWMLFGRPA
jgi:Ni,Fe-hydrogenase I cytochrome b subunit